MAASLPGRCSRMTSSTHVSVFSVQTRSVSRMLPAQCANAATARQAARTDQPVTNCQSAEKMCGEKRAQWDEHVVSLSPHVVKKGRALTPILNRPESRNKIE